MVKTLVSVIIPCYNAEKYLVDCLDSVLQQDWPHLEVICIMMEVLITRCSS